MAFMASGKKSRNAFNRTVAQAENSENWISLNNSEAENNFKERKERKETDLEGLGFDDYVVAFGVHNVSLDETLLVVRHPAVLLAVVRHLLQLVQSGLVDGEKGQAIVLFHSHRNARQRNGAERRLRGQQQSPCRRVSTAEIEPQRAKQDYLCETEREQRIAKLEFRFKRACAAGLS